MTNWNLIKFGVGVLLGFSTGFTPKSLCFLALLMPRAVNMWYKRLGGHTRTQRDSVTPSSTIPSLISGGKGNKLHISQEYVFLTAQTQTASEINEEIIFGERNDLRHLFNQFEARFSIDLTQSSRLLLVLRWMQCCHSEESPDQNVRQISATIRLKYPSAWLVCPNCWRVGQVYGK